MPTPLPAPALLRRLDNGPVSADLSAGLRALAKDCGLKLDPDAELAKSWCLFWVAELAPSLPLAGFCLAWAVADEIELISIGTPPQARRQGIARRLMETLIAEGKRSGARAIFLEVRSRNTAALKLYRAFGFTALEERRAYYPDGEDATLMSLNLPPATASPLQQ